MGEYTRFKFDALLRSDAPAEAITLLTAMLAGKARDLTALPIHPLFKTERWSSIGYSGGSAFKVEPPPSAFIATDCGYSMSFDCAFKNYDREVDAFCNWIAPYLANHVGSVVGLVQNEEERIFDAPGALLVMQQGSICQLREPEREREDTGLWPLEPTTAYKP